MSKTILAKINSDRRKAVSQLTDGKTFAAPEMAAYSVDGLAVGQGGAALTFSSLKPS